MRRMYDGEFDSAYISCELGVAKPAGEFFRRILADLGAAPDEVFFVDDTEANVEGARRVGLRAMHWRHEDGLDGFVAAAAELKRVETLEGEHLRRLLAGEPTASEN